MWIPLISFSLSSLSRCLLLPCGPYSSALFPPSLLDAARWDQVHCAIIVFPETEHCGRQSCPYRRSFHATSPPSATLTTLSVAKPTRRSRPYRLDRSPPAIL